MKLAGPVFQWHPDNHFRLLVDGPTFFPRMIEAIRRADSSLRLTRRTFTESSNCSQLVWAQALRPSIWTLA